jgi:hypothetical protein
MTATSMAASRREETRELRKLSKLVGIWGLCQSGAGRRARACHGEPRDCLPRYAPLVPEDVRDSAEAIVEAWSRGLSFEEFHAETDTDIHAMARG